MTTAGRTAPVGLGWAISLLGLFSDGELAEIVAFENAPTEPAPPPDGCELQPESAPAVDAVDDGSDEWLIFGRGVP